MPTLTRFTFVCDVDAHTKVSDVDAYDDLPWIDTLPCSSFFVVCTMLFVV